MKITKKMLLAGAMAAVFSVSGQFVQTNGTLGVQTAEAGIGGLGGLGKGIAGKALGVDVDQLQDKKQNMILNLSKAALCYVQAAIDIQEALGYDQGQIASTKAAFNGLANDKTNLGAMKKVGDVVKLDEKEIAAKAKAVQDSGDQEKIAKANELLKKAKAERKVANKYKILAARDASAVISGAMKALAKSDELGDKVNTVKELSETAKTAKSVTDVIGEGHKAMTNGLKAYEKQNNIQDVSDDDAEKQMKDQKVLID